MKFKNRTDKPIILVLKDGTTFTCLPNSSLELTLATLQLYGHVQLLNRCEMGRS